MNRLALLALLTLAGLACANDNVYAPRPHRPIVAPTTTDAWTPAEYAELCKASPAICASVEKMVAESLGLKP